MRIVCRLIGHRWHRGPVERLHASMLRYRLSIVCRRCGRTKTAETPEVVGRVCAVTEDDQGIAISGQFLQGVYVDPVEARRRAGFGDMA